MKTIGDLESFEETQPALLRLHDGLTRQRGWQNNRQEVPRRHMLLRSWLNSAASKVTGALFYDLN